MRLRYIRVRMNDAFDFIIGSFFLFIFKRKLFIIYKVKIFI